MRNPTDTEKGILLYLVASEMRREDKEKFHNNRGDTLSNVCINLAAAKIAEAMITPGMDYDHRRLIKNPYRDSADNNAISVRNLVKDGYMAAHRSHRGTRLIPNESGIDLLIENGMLDGKKPAIETYRRLLATEERRWIVPVAPADIGGFSDVRRATLGKGLVASDNTTRSESWQEASKKENAGMPADPSRDAIVLKQVLNQLVADGVSNQSYVEMLIGQFGHRYDKSKSQNAR